MPCASPPPGVGGHPPSGLQRAHAVVGLVRWRAGQGPRRAVLATEADHDAGVVHAAQGVDSDLVRQSGYLGAVAA